MVLRLISCNCQKENCCSHFQRQKRTNFRIPYFAPPDAAPCTVPPGRMPPFAPPLPTATGHQLFHRHDPNCKKCLISHCWRILQKISDLDAKAGGFRNLIYSALSTVLYVSSQILMKIRSLFLRKVAHRQTDRQTNTE